MRSTSRSCPTMTRLISNIARSMRVASLDGGTGAAPAAELPARLDVSRGLLAALVTWLPGRAGPRPPRREGAADGTAYPSTASVLQVAGRALTPRNRDTDP